MPTKDEIYWKILNSAISLEMQRGHQKWSVTQLAEMSGVSRTSIYYYFGKSKMEILKEAVQLLGSELSGETDQRRSLWKEGKLAESFCNSRKLVQQTPALLPFYFLNRNSSSELGKLIRKKEADFRSKLMHFFPGRDATDYEALYALFFGLSFAGELSDLAVHRAVNLLLKGIGPQSA